MRKSTALLATLALAAGAFAGCGDDDDTATTPPPPAAGGEIPAGAGSDAAKVGMRNLRFDPETISVKAGDKIVWTNNESIQHNVVAEKGAEFESELLDQDDTFEYTPQDEGTIEYVCTLHPGMDGTVTVTK